MAESAKNFNIVTESAAEAHKKTNGPWCAAPLRAVVGNGMTSCPNPDKGVKQRLFSRLFERPWLVWPFFLFFSDEADFVSVQIVTLS